VRASALGLVVLLTLVTIRAGRTGLADVYAEPAKLFLQTKRDAGEVLTGAEWQAVFTTLEQALVLAPGDPRNLSELGRLHRIVLEADDLDAQEILRFGDAAARYYTAALAVRPTWPWDWGNLALVRYEQYQDTSPVLHDALVHAVEFGPREAALQGLVVDVGLDSWAALPPTARSAVLTAVDRALERDSAAVIELLTDPEAAQAVCGAAGEEYPFVRKHCGMLGLA
jgi:hypothetical protein